MDMYLSDFYR